MKTSQKDLDRWNQEGRNKAMKLNVIMLAIIIAVLVLPFVVYYR